ncbi:unnamed protein product [Caenorhabditis sp. 36 PRJEB53466]|nr:unnamed protein product [Caenorhabditis sp. 36 PRJEB53466]
MARSLMKPSKHQLKHVLDQMSDLVEHAELEANLATFHEESKLTAQANEFRMSLIMMLTAYLRSSEIVGQLKFEGIEIAGITAFGSWPTPGMALPVSILQAIYRDMKYKMTARAYFENHSIRDICFVQTAKVPIIRFKIDGIQFDLSSTLERNPPRTSLAAKFINAYCQIDRRVPLLITFIKSWMKSEGSADDHLRDFPNSYSLILMLVHVLQWYDILPNIHQTHKEMFSVENFKNWNDVEINNEFYYPLDENTIALHRKRPTDKLTVVQLLWLFCSHYQNDHIFRECRFNMKNGRIEQRSKSSREHSFEILCPYDVRNPARSARSTLEFTAALKELGRILNTPHRYMLHSIRRITAEKTYFPSQSSSQLFQQSYMYYPHSQNVLYPLEAHQYVYNFQSRPMNVAQPSISSSPWFPYSPPNSLPPQVCNPQYAVFVPHMQNQSQRK